MKLLSSTSHSQPFLSRTVHTALLSFDGPTPRKDELKEFFTDALGKSEMMTISKVTNRYGERKALVEVRVYHDKSAMDYLERL